MFSEIIFTAIEGLIIITAFSLLSYQRAVTRSSIIRVSVFILVYTLYTYWVTLFIPTGLHSILIGVLTVLASNYAINGTILKSMLKYFFIFIGLTIIETLIALFSMFIFKSNIYVLLQNETYVFICSIIAKICELLAVHILYRINPKIPWLNDTKLNHSRFTTILITIATVFFIMIGASVYISNNPQSLFMFYILSFVIYIVLIVTVVMAIREGARLEMIQLASEMKKENVQQLIEFNEMVAKERHEYKNHLNTIYGLCTLNKPDLSDKIKLYINNFANNSETQNISIDSGNDFVDAIINVKYNNALRKGIDVLVDFEVPLSMARIDEDVAVTIISNIIENAFESIITVEQEKRYINLQTYLKDNKYYISISNNGPKINEADKKRIFNAGFSTKENTSKKRGFGLSIVKSEIERSNGNICINSTEDVTEFLISLEVQVQQAAI